MSRMNITARTIQNARTTFVSALALLPAAAVTLMMAMRILGYWTY